METIENLKAKAYDLIAAKQNIEMQLNQVNQMIAKMSQEKKPEVEEAKK